MESLSEKVFKKPGSLRIFAPQEVRNYAIMMYMMGGGTTCFVSACRIPADSRVFRKTATILFVIILLAVFSGPVTAAQEAVGINYFDIAHSDAGTPACWDLNRTYIYLGSPATFANCSYAVPINTIDGNSVLVFTTTYTGGWWTVWFNLDWGHSVNYLRYGSNPMLYLRVKWGAVASGANVKITLRDNQDIWNSYAQYAGQSGAYSYEEASVYLNSYVTPSTVTWQDVYIPMSAFRANNPNIDLTRISVLILQNGTTHYSATNTLYIQKVKVVRDTGFANGYSDMVKVNQLGYLPNQRKLAFVSYEASTVSPAPTYFQVKDANSGAVVYQANLTLDTVHAPTGGGSEIWDYSNDTLYDANFTSFTTPGRYVIYCPELGQTSPVFNIGNKVFDRPLRDVLRYFYYARCSRQIVEPYAEGHTRPAIYANNINCAYDYTHDDSTHMYNYDPNNLGITTRDVSGGLFDAGDVHLDIHDNVVPMWFLLETYKDFKEKLGPSVLNLSESDSQTNDLVLLIKYELDWFKKM
jgi:hypothetical protein